MERRTDVKVGIGVPIFNSVCANVYVNHIRNFAAWYKELCDVVILSVDGHPTADARSAIVEASLEQKCTHTFLISADCVVPEHALPRLLSYTDLDIIGGVICSKIPMFCQMSKISHNGEYLSTDFPFDGKVYEVDVVPLNCCLIKNDWFSKIGRPYFKNESHELGRMRIRQNKDHSIVFCEDAKKLGAKICVDTGILVGHGSGSVVVAPDPETRKGRIEIR